MLNARKRRMRYFITGGAGFIGSMMVDRLLINSENSVTIYDNFCSGKEEFISHNYGDARFKVITGDLLDYEYLKSSLTRHDFVMHFAANPDIARSAIEPELDFRQGTVATFNVLEAMRQNGVKMLLYSSGSGIYGDVGYTEASEDFGPLFPISMYGASKLACEGMISAFVHLYDMKAWIFRFANVVGGRQTHGVGYDFIRKLRHDPKNLQIQGDGSQSKSYIHVNDVLDAMLFTVNKCDEKINFFNIATDDYIDVNAIAKIVVSEMALNNVKFSYTGGTRGWKGDVPVVRFNLSKIHSLGWRSGFSSEEAILLSIKQMIENTS